MKKPRIPQPMDNDEMVDLGVPKPGVMSSAPKRRKAKKVAKRKRTK